MIRFAGPERCTRCRGPLQDNIVRRVEGDPICESCWSEFESSWLDGPPAVSPELQGIVFGIALLMVCFIVMWVVQ